MIDVTDKWASSDPSLPKVARKGRPYHGDMLFHLEGGTYLKILPNKSVGTHSLILIRRNKLYYLNTTYSIRNIDICIEETARKAIKAIGTGSYWWSLYDVIVTTTPLNNVRHQEFEAEILFASLVCSLGLDTQSIGRTIKDNYGPFFWKGFINRIKKTESDMARAIGKLTDEVASQVICMLYTSGISPHEFIYDIYQGALTEEQHNCLVEGAVKLKELKNAKQSGNAEPHR